MEYWPEFFVHLSVGYTYTPLNFGPSWRQKYFGQFEVTPPTENQPCSTPKSQWNSSLSIQCCLLDPYGRIKVVDSCLLCPCGCWWPRKLCWQLGSITDFVPKFCWEPTLQYTKEPMKLFLVHTMLFVVCTTNITIIICYDLLHVRQKNCVVVITVFT
jgi:hypothetical protein